MNMHCRDQRQLGYQPYHAEHTWTGQQNRLLVCYATRISRRQISVGRTTILASQFAPYIDTEDENADASSSSQSAPLWRRLSLGISERGRTLFALRILMSGLSASCWNTVHGTNGFRKDTNYGKRLYESSIAQVNLWQRADELRRREPRSPWAMEFEWKQRILGCRLICWY